MNRYRSPALLLCLLASAGCGDDDDATNDAAPADGDVVDAGGPDVVAPDLSCQGMTPDASTAVPATITLTGVARQAGSSTGMVLPGFTVTAHAREDLTAASPLATVVTGDDGAYALEVATGGKPFDGYVRLSKDASIVPLQIFASAPVVMDADNFQAPVFSKALVDTLAAFAQVTPQAGDGMLILSVEGCGETADGGPVNAAGVVVSASTADKDTKVVYFGPQQFPDPMATSTSSSGIVWIVNLPPGPTTITGTVAGTSLQPNPVLILPDSMSAAALRP